VIIHDNESLRLSRIIGGSIVKAICNLVDNSNIFDESNTNSFIEKYILRSYLHMISLGRNRYSDDYVTMDWDRENMITLVRINYSFWCFYNKFQHFKHHDILQYSNKPIIIEFPSHPSCKFCMKCSSRLTDHDDSNCLVPRNMMLLGRLQRTNGQHLFNLELVAIYRNRIQGDPNYPEPFRMYYCPYCGERYEFDLAIINH
jgi:hypothetical protein